MFLELSLIAVLTVLSFKRIKKEFKTVKYGTWALLIVILLFGFYLRNNVYTHYHYEDGWKYQEVAKYMLKYFRFQGCNIGNMYNCELARLQVHPGGYPAIITIFYLIFGVNSLYAIAASVVLSTLTIALVFLISHILFENEDISLLSAFIFSIIPMNLRISSTSLSEPTSMFFISASFFLLVLSLKRRVNLQVLSLLAVTTSFAIQTRRENFLLLPIFVLIYLTLKPKIRIRKLMMAAAFFALLSAFDIVYFISKIGGFIKQTEHPAFSLDYLSVLLLPYLRVFFDSAYFPPLLSLCLLVSIAYIRKSEIRVLFLPLAAYSLLFTSFMQNPVSITAGKLEIYQILFYSL